MKPFRGWFAAAFAIALGGTASCDSESGTIVDNFPGLTPCATVSDCRPGLACSERYGVCFRPMPAGAPLVFTITPAAGSGMVQDQFDGVECPQPGRIDITMTPATVIKGYILPPYGDDGGDYRGAGRLFAEAPGRIPGLSFRHDARTTAGSIGSKWEIPLAPDRDYMLTFVADNPDVPPASWSVGAGISGGMDLRVSTPVFKLSGVVRRLVGNEKIPLPGALVEAFAAGRRSTSCVTDNNGVFTLSVPETDGSISIVTSPGDSGLVFPRGTLSFDGIDDLRNRLPRTDFMAIDVQPADAIATISFQVLSVSTGVSRIPIAGASIFIDQRSGDGVFRYRSVIDDNGFFALDLPAGIYQVAVMPPGGGPDAPLKSAQFSWTGAEVQFDGQTDRIFGMELPRRPMVTGRIVDAATAAPVQGARVILATDSSQLADWHSSFATDLLFEALTDENGEFSVRLEPAIYAMQVRPPAGSGLATASWPSVAITGTENLRAELGGVCLLGGRFVSTDGKAASGATVTFFQPTTADTWQAWPMRDAYWANALREVGSTRAGSDGSWEILLPCPDAPSSATGGVFMTW